MAVVMHVCVWPAASTLTAAVFDTLLLYFQKSGWLLACSTCVWLILRCRKRQRR